MAIKSVMRTLMVFLWPTNSLLTCSTQSWFEAEAMMNSGPLTNFSDALEHDEQLTTNHIMLQRLHNSLPSRVLPSNKPASMKSWKNVHQFLGHIWRRMVREYLPTLMKRPKCIKSNRSSRKVDDVERILKYINPRSIWHRGSVEEVFPG